jgi:hypothetical protein
VGAFTDVFSLGETMKCFLVDLFPRCPNQALDTLKADWISYADTLKAPLTEDRPSVKKVSEQMIVFAQMASLDGNGINYLSREMSKEPNIMNSNNQETNGSDAAYPSGELSEPSSTEPSSADTSSAESSSAASIDVAALLFPFESLAVSPDTSLKDTEDPKDLIDFPVDYIEVHEDLIVDHPAIVDPALIDPAPIDHTEDPTELIDFPEEDIEDLIVDHLIPDPALIDPSVIVPSVTVSAITRAHIGSGGCNMYICLNHIVSLLRVRCIYIYFLCFKGE